MSLERVRWLDVGNGRVHFGIRCPGCDEVHALDERWTFNDNFERPTFTPSLLCRGERPEPFVCHSFITDGRIQFLSDCTHALAGQTVDLPPFSWPE